MPDFNDTGLNTRHETTQNQSVHTRNKYNYATCKNRPTVLFKKLGPIHQN